MFSQINIKIFFITGFLIVFCTYSFAQEKDYLAELEYEIKYEIDFSRLNVKGFFINNTTESIEAEYLLKVFKSSGSGKAVSDQKGSFNVPPMEKIFLSESGMNIEEDAVYSISLEITNGTQVIAEKSINIKGQEF